MKKKGICPKCNSKNIIKKKGTPTLNTWFRLATSQTSLDIWLSKYICLGCGYIEEYVDNKNDLQKLQAKPDDESCY